MNEILRVENLEKTFPIHGGLFYQKIAEINAVSNVSFTVNEGETLGIVGESGCGKSTLGKTLMRLWDADAGKVFIDGQSLFDLEGAELKSMRKNLQMIFQDPFSCLNPRMSVNDIIREPLDIFKIGKKAERQQKVAQIAETVGLSRKSLSRYPHEFSGGQRQRIGIARSIISRPKIIVADEPVSALDVSIQSQIINLLTDLQKQMKLTILFISHDLSVVEYVSDNIGVMYLGKIIEIAPKALIFSRPKHPYTVSLLSAIPEPNPRLKKKRIIPEGDVPSPINPPSGCAFHPRCFKAQKKCAEQTPVLNPHGDGQMAACFYPE